jgi:hypothetical protein
VRSWGPRGGSLAMTPDSRGRAIARLPATPMALHGIELHIDEPPFVQATSRCYAESACCKQMFQMFYRYVASVSYGYCKSRSGCCICCNGCARMLQGFIPNVSSIFQTYVARVFIWRLHMFHTYVAYIFAMVTSVFSVFVSFSDACFKCFICP